MSIEEFNPWWRGSGYINYDPDIVKWSSAKVRWIPKEANTISLKPFSLNFIYGPRQVGKTTMMKLIIRDLLNRVKPEAVFYYSCDLLSDYEELLNVLRRYLRIKEEHGIEVSYIFLDEVTYVDEWFRAIKYSIDRGLFKNDVVTITGSTSISLRREVETFPGRRGYGVDVVLYPLSFQSYVKTLRPEIEVSPGWYGEIKELFEKYLITGGFPLSINSYINFNTITSDVYKSYIDWITYDIRRMGRDEKLVKEVLSILLETAGSRVSYNSIAKELNVSHRTISEYIDLLSRMLLIVALNYIDVNTGNRDYRKLIKVHFIDPFIYRVISLWTGVKPPDDAIIVEGVVASHLSRVSEVGYTVIGSREIDVVSASDFTGYEVKFRERARGVDVKAGKMKKVITISKDTEDINIIPAHVFLAQLNA
ncbi:ATP-binding protein [Caldivirga sp. UBA161]|uniref:ATP-binding protein n=1 Tax=Caldivirga sp. UBA161 TaxID=1915569 RepID=UPI0025C5BCB3|nr:ATP-binding protein [Caldivirga sp. UBA161]